MEKIIVENLENQNKIELNNQQLVKDQQDDNNEEQFDLENSLFNENQEPLKKNPINHLKFTEPEIIKKLYKLMKEIDEILIQNGIYYWISCGTTLGCVRHKGLIPWDDDLDICIKEEDSEKLKNLQDKFQKKNLGITEIEFGFKIFFKNDQNTETADKINQNNKEYEQYGFPFCDVFVMKKKSKKWIIKDKGSQRTCPKEIYKDQQIKNLQRKLFGNFEVNIVSDVESYLDFMYGSDWKITAKTHFWDHVNQQFVEPEVFKLTEQLLKPAYPFE